MNGKDNISCFDRKFDEKFIENCTFINNGNNNNLFLIGGSQISSLGYNLKQRLPNLNYSHFSFGGYIYLPGFDNINKINKKDKVTK